MRKPDYKVSKMVHFSKKNTNCSETTFSKTLDKNGSFEIGLKFFESVGSRFDFLRSGSTMACLKQLGKTPVESDSLNSLLIQGPITSNTFKKSLQGRASDGQKEGFILVTRAEIYRPVLLV